MNLLIDVREQWVSVVYNSNSTKILIQDMNKVPRCTIVVPRQVHESSFCKSKEVYETSPNHWKVVAVVKPCLWRATLMKCIHAERVFWPRLTGCKIAINLTELFPGCALRVCACLAINRHNVKYRCDASSASFLAAAAAATSVLATSCPREGCEVFHCQC